MKKLFYLIPALFLAGILFYACQEPNVIEPDSSSINKDVDGYEIVLIGGEPVDNGDGTYTWTWSITQNTAQYALSHWNFLPGLCLAETDIVSAAYRYGSVGEYTPIVLESPYFETDPSMDCEGENPVFKFDYGTTDNLGQDVTTFYQLVVNKNFEVDPNATAYWKASTDCGEGNFDGIGCEIVVDPCTYETAWADGIRYVDRGNWATYTPRPDDGVPVILYAGQTMEAGTVVFSDGGLTITINFNSGWDLDDVLEPVKIQGYDVAPTSNPSPGLFTTYKGDDLEINLGQVYAYYGIHLDVKWCPPEPCDDPAVTWADFSGMPTTTTISSSATELVGVTLCDGKTVEIQATNISSSQFKFNGGPLGGDFWQDDHSVYGDLNNTGTSRMNTRCLNASGSAVGVMPNNYTLTWDFGNTPLDHTNFFMIGQFWRPENVLTMTAFASDGVTEVANSGFAFEWLPAIAGTFTFLEPLTWNPIDGTLRKAVTGDGPNSGYGFFSIPEGTEIGKIVFEVSDTKTSGTADELNWGIGCYGCN
jgi:hypothetical protein